MGKVNLTKKIVGATGQRCYYPVMVADNGRIKADWVVVNGSPEKHPEGTYYIDWTEKGSRRRQSVGKNPIQATAKQLRKEAELKAVEQGILLSPDQDGAADPRGVTIVEAASAYLEDIKLGKKPKTLSAYTTALGYFQESCSKVFLSEIDRKDLLRFTSFLRDDKKQSARSCWNKFGNIITFLKVNGIEKLMKRGDWPSFVEEEPEIYEKAELDKFFRACAMDELTIFKFFLMTGMREQEVMHLMLRDINFSNGVVYVRWKPSLNWTPKAYKEREIPVPDTLLELLEKYKKKEKRQDRELFFPNQYGKVNGHFYKKCLIVAKRAGLSKDDWWLHKFRATFATTHLMAGRDLRTVQKWLGHSDIESTMRYLRPARSAQVRDQVNSTFM